MEKNYKFWGFAFFVGDFISGVGFKPFWPRLPGPGPQPQDGCFLFKLSVESRLKSSEPLIDFLACLVQK